MESMPIQLPCFKHFTCWMLRIRHHSQLTDPSLEVGRSILQYQSFRLDCKEYPGGSQSEGFHTIQEDWETV